MIIYCNQKQYQKQNIPNSSKISIFDNILMLKYKSIILPLLFIGLVFNSYQVCVHDDFAANATYHYYNDLTETSDLKSGRLLQTGSNSSSNFGKLRIYADYTALKTGGQTQQNIIKRIMNITANYFYNIIKVQRLTVFKYPSDAPQTCNILTVPSVYMREGVIGDLVILVTNQVNTVQYIAKSIACLLQKSNNRPLMGIMIWNNNYLEYDQVGFQKSVYVGIHELTHILGYSASMYDKYPKGNPYRNVNNTQYLTSDQIVQEMKNHFGCDNPLGIILEDQDGTLIPSHNQRQIFGNQFMIASGKKSSFFSRFTLALLNSTGWYDVSFDYAQPTTWGKSKGCSFLNTDNCTSSQFCTGSDFGCDWDTSAIGKCNLDPFAGSCKLINYYVNTICIDENYELKNLNSQLQALERGGYNSRCHTSNFRKTGLTPNILNNRCYVTVCSSSKSYLYILVGNNVLVCSSSKLGQQINAPQGLEGTLKCPASFNNYCDNKKTCSYHCNKNGACINGQCLCTGATQLTSTCLQTSLTITQMQNTGGLTKAIKIIGDNLILENTPVNKGFRSIKNNQNIDNAIKKGLKQRQLQIIREKSINNPIGEGMYKSSFGYIFSCTAQFGCTQCTENGCLRCPEKQTLVNGKCQKSG